VRDRCTKYDAMAARELRLRHFIAYVRGGSLFTGNLSQGGESNNARFDLFSSSACVYFVVLN